MASSSDCLFSSPARHFCWLRVGSSIGATLSPGCTFLGTEQHYRFLVRQENTPTRFLLYVLRTTAYYLLLLGTYLFLSAGSELQVRACNGEC